MRRRSTRKASRHKDFFAAAIWCARSASTGAITIFSKAGLKDNINRGGEKFGAEEVENIIVRHPSVNDVRVVAMPDPFLGEKACAFIIAKPGEPLPSVAALGEFLQQQGLAKFKLPERIEAVSEFPVTRVGKVDKQALRRIIADTLAREASGEEPKVA